MNVLTINTRFLKNSVGFHIGFGLVINTLFSSFLMAQNKVTDSIEWNIATHLPTTNQIEKQLGVAGPVVGLINDRLLIAGGANFPDKMPWYGGAKQIYDDIYLYEKDDIGNLSAINVQQSLPYKIAYPASASTEKGVLIIGGETETGLSDKVILIAVNKKDGSFLFKNLPQLPFAVSNAAAVSVGNKIYLAGGETENQQVSDVLIMLDMEALEKGWQQKMKLPKKLSHLMFVGNDEKLYVIGGRKRNVEGLTDFSSNVYSYDLKEDEWKERSNLPYALSAGTALIFENEILVFGGDIGKSFHKAELVINVMADETDTLKKQILNQIKIDIQTNHPGFSDGVLRYDILANKWNAINAIKFRVPVTTMAVKWDGLIFIPTGEVKAGIRTSQILRGKVHYK